MLVERPVRGCAVLDRDGTLVGKVTDTWPEDGGGVPELALVAVGNRFPRSRYVPLADARLAGDFLVVPMTRGEIDEAPSADDRRWGHPADLARSYWLTAGD
jgi:hypothetical protein